MKEEIDFKNEPLGKLFAQLFFPTLLGMIFTAAINIADGIFVGQGIGSDALAAINIVSPMYLVTSGIGLMFGAGASVVAAIDLSTNKFKEANINVSQAVYSSIIIMTIISVAVFIFAPEFAHVFGSTPRLDPLAIEYLRYFVLACPMFVLEGIGLFTIRLDGSPKYAMMCSALPAIINIVLDYIFVFPLNMGIKGAALATDAGLCSGAFMIFYYYIFKSNKIKLLSLSATYSNFKRSLRNIWYMIKIGSSALLGELAISYMMFIGNHCYLTYLQEDGIAAFSVLCYCFPVFFMINTAIAQSAQPIISYNYGAGENKRVRRMLKMAMFFSVISGLLTSVAVITGKGILIGGFLKEGTNAYNIGYEGLPLFATGLLFLAINIVAIGYYQSIEQAKIATWLTVLRGFVYIGIAFYVLPSSFGAIGLWLVIPAAELLTTITILIVIILKKRRNRMSENTSEM